MVCFTAIPKINIFDSMFKIGHTFILPRFARHTENFPGSDFLSYKLLSFFIGHVTLNVREQGFSKHPVWRVIPFIQYLNCLVLCSAALISCGEMVSFCMEEIISSVTALIVVPADLTASRTFRNLSQSWLTRWAICISS